MTNKEFKELIKKHIVKQAFCRLIKPDTILRFYYSILTDKRYIAIWTIKEQDVQITIEENVSKRIWHYHTLKYLDECIKVQKDFKKLQEDCKNSQVDCKKLKTMPDLEQFPMCQRKFWKIWYDTIGFMSKDMRMEEK